MRGALCADRSEPVRRYRGVFDRGRSLLIIDAMKLNHATVLVSATRPPGGEAAREE